MGANILALQRENKLNVKKLTFGGHLSDSGPVGLPHHGYEPGISFCRLHPALRLFMPNPDDKGFLIYSKRDVIRGHLNNAIFLFFQEKEISSVHTLTAAALEMLKSIAGKSGISFGLDLEQAVPAEGRKGFRQFVNRPKNFFKHADRDADDICRFHPDSTFIELMQAEDAYGTIYGQITYPMQIFRLWMLNEAGKKGVLVVDEVQQQLTAAGQTPESFTKKIASQMIHGREQVEFDCVPPRNTSIRKRKP